MLAQNSWYCKYANAHNALSQIRLTLEYVKIAVAALRRKPSALLLMLVQLLLLPLLLAALSVAQSDSTAVAHR
jgi:hypothetical protein